MPVSFIQVSLWERTWKSALAPSRYFNPIKGHTSSHSSYNESDLRERAACVYERMHLMLSNDSDARWPFEFQGERPLPAEPTRLTASDSSESELQRRSTGIGCCSVIQTTFVARRPVLFVKDTVLWQKSKEMLERTYTERRAVIHTSAGVGDQETADFVQHSYLFEYLKCEDGVSV